MSEIGMMKVLDKVGEDIVVKTAAVHEPKEFFKDRKGLWIGSDFEERILSKAEATPADKEFPVSAYQLLVDLKDEALEKTLPEKHSFSESEVCAVVAGLIVKQPEGEEGALLNNGYSNIFYTPEFVVRVSWHASGREWDVGTWYRGGGWDAGYRVFSPAN